MTLDWTRSVLRRNMGGDKEVVMRRHEIADGAWERIASLLPGKEGDPGGTAADNRLFVNAVFWVARTGAPWRDLPERFGKWNTAFVRFNRWCKKGVWDRVFVEVQEPDLEWLFLDSSVIRAHRHAAGALKKKPATRPAARPSAAVGAASARS